MNCQLKKGIFVQRTCNIPTSDRCDECEMEICKKHQKILEGRVLCHSCYTKEVNLDRDTGYHYYMEDESDFYLWYWAMRSDYDTEYGIEAFDEGDYDGFENVEEGDYQDFDYDNEDDFLDS